MVFGPFLFRPRHPLARLAIALLGVIAVAGLLTLGVFALAAFVLGGALFALVNALRQALRPRAATSPPPPAGIIEGEFTVVEIRDRSHPPS
ncbi:MAG: hypothetical protein GXC76_08735 [Rhodanobacteraceae bacterium]|jgi:uncharacterized protein (DUF58 family)|nr:hypothetical protein [Rhodanobacteraceae bacterium]